MAITFMRASIEHFDLGEDMARIQFSWIDVAGVPQHVISEPFRLAEFDTEIPGRFAYSLGMLLRQQLWDFVPSFEHLAKRGKPLEPAI